MYLKPLSPVDQMFLWLERRTQPMHVGGLELLKLPPGQGPEWIATQVERLRQAVVAQPPFNQRLVRRLGSWFWTEDSDFDLEAHFRYLALPAPGRIRELLALVSQLHAAHLDRARPLWEFYIISGLEDGRFAIYAKVHHAMVDGVAAMRLLRRSMSEDAQIEAIPPWTMQRRAGRDGAPYPPGALSNTAQLLASVREQASSLPAVARELIRSIREARDNPDHVSAFQAPRSILNQRISGSRRFAAQSYPLARIRAVVRRHHATVNDIVLAMCASALRRYLLELDALPARPLIAMVPLSLRRDESEEGNRIALILANLGTHLADPLARLATIQGSVLDAKRRYARMGATAMLNYVAAVMAPAGLNIATGLAPRWQSFNVIISNVPGPKRPLYWSGAPLDGMYPVSVVTDGLALNITLTSYVDRVEFGVIACRRTLPRVQRLLDYFEEGLAELEDTPAAVPEASDEPGAAASVPEAPARRPRRRAPAHPQP
ncbi:WS/DGAT/MGAT family O-acyltransferase [Solimonas variicoloris]|uniref:WS/DGAT/MGAT family O-acyltransferase n=1 Tax=Solimonas variicoloris TaxID=254408 RepID=UPI000379D452|nr:wax ester/triacylglycerol synthase family O-acyltransferase [Solimonas variicoloris]